MARRDTLTRGARGDVWQARSAGIVHAVVGFVYVVVPVAGVALVVWLVVDAFTSSAEEGTRSLCAALVPILVCSYIRWVKSEWLEALEKVPNLSLMAGSALGTIGMITILTSDSTTGVFAELAVSLAFSTMLLARTDAFDSDRLSDAFDEKLLHFFFGIAIALTLFGLFRLEG